MKIHVSVFFLAFYINGCEARGTTCSAESPELSWPLHSNTGITEVINNAAQGFIESVTYMPTTPGDDTATSSAMEFAGENPSMVALHVPYNVAFLEDYIIQFYAYFHSVTRGTILFYESDAAYSAEDIEKFNISINNGSVDVEITNYGSVSYPVDIRPGQWNHIMYERDFSREAVKLYVNRTGQNEMHISKTFVEKPTKAPGTLYLGGYSSSKNQFAGRIACLQIIPCKSITDLKYDDYCKTSLYTYTTGSMNSATTGLSMEITTGSSIGTTTGSSMDTTTGSSMGTTTGSLIGTATGSSMETTAGPTAGLATSSTGSTAHELTDTSMSATGVRHEGSTKSVLTSQDLHFNVENSCSHFAMVHEHATFGNVADIIETAFVIDSVACTRHCNMFRSCFTFAVKAVTDGYECSIGGSNSTDITTLKGSKFYKRI